MKSFTYFNSDGNSLQLPVVVLPPWSVVQSVIEMDSDSSLLQVFKNLLRFSDQKLVILLTLVNGHNHDLVSGHSGRKNKT